MTEYIIADSAHGKIKRKKHARMWFNNPCWTCAKAPCDGCAWAKDKKPVPGWIAEPIVIPDNYPFDKGYHITYCPEYEEKGKSDYNAKYKKVVYGE